MALAADPAAKEKAEAASPTGRDPGFCLDSGHVHCSGLDVATPIRTAGSHLLTTHLHDNLGGADPRLPIPKTNLCIWPWASARSIGRRRFVPWTRSSTSGLP